MGHYILHFSIYTMAMIGLIFFALFIYKKFSITTMSLKRKGIIKVEDALGLSPRKTLYIIKAGEEKFLIAADLDKTTLISKLNLQDEETEKIAEE
ncbi:flagellar biosynthetic protein FliO [bacterium]|nr:flagellar biosynthetic protein FliO [bacterium]